MPKGKRITKSDETTWIQKECLVRMWPIGKQKDQKEEIYLPGEQRIAQEGAAQANVLCRGESWMRVGEGCCAKQTEQAENRVKGLLFLISHLACATSCASSSSQLTPRPQGYHICHWDYKLPLGSRGVALSCDLAGERLFFCFDILCVNGVWNQKAEFGILYFF